MQTVILAGGRGERLRPLTDHTPKPLLKVGGTPLIERLVAQANKHGADSVLICAGYKAEQMEEYFSGKTTGVQISVTREEKPLGTAGPLRASKAQLEDDFVVLYGDVYTTIDLKKLHAFHTKNKADATLAVHTSDHPQDSTVVTMDATGRITALAEKPGAQWKRYGNLTNAGVYVLSKTVLHFIHGPSDLAKDIFPAMLKAGSRLYGYRTNAYTKDIGTPERYREVNERLA